MPSHRTRVLAFIDESGSLPDPADSVVVIAAVIAEESERGLERLLAKIRRRLPRKGKRKRERRIGELKFRKTSPKTRRQVLSALAQQDVALFVGVVGKDSVGIKDTPNNYATLASLVLVDCVNAFPNLDRIVLDRHFSRPADQETTSRVIRVRLRREVIIEQVDSLQDPRIDLADFVAGAVNFARTHGDTTYEDLIRGKIAEYKVARWSEKRKW